MDSVKIGNVTASRFLLGSNPFSGFSHQGNDRDTAMVSHYTTARIKEALYQAEKLGITGIVARADFHVLRLLREYWDEGGRLQWFAQTCPELGPTELSVARAIKWGAKGCHVHGGVMDYLVHQGKADEAKLAVDMIRKAGLKAGIAGHNVRVFEWMKKNLEVDYCMCCYYNPTPREDDPEHVHGAQEKYVEAHRQAMVEMIQTIPNPVIHYKVLAAGRNDPDAALAFAANHMRPSDMLCVGVMTKDDPNQLKADVELFEKHWKEKK